MFNIGGGELLVIFLVALIVLGPQRLPSAARTVGKVMGDIRRVSTGFQRELREAFEEADREAGTAPAGSGPPGARVGRAGTTRDDLSLADAVADADRGRTRGGAAPGALPAGTVAPEVADAIDQVTAAAELRPAEPPDDPDAPDERAAS